MERGASEALPRLPDFLRIVTSLGTWNLRHLAKDPLVISISKELTFLLWPLPMKQLLLPIHVQLKAVVGRRVRTNRGPSERQEAQLLQINYREQKMANASHAFLRAVSLGFCMMSHSFILRYEWYCHLYFMKDHAEA